MTVHYETDGDVAIVTIDRPEVANAVDRPTADALVEAFRRFEHNESLGVAVLTGAHGKFCAGADLKAMQGADGGRVSRLSPHGDGPVGPTRMLLGKPVIAAIEHHAVGRRARAGPLVRPARRGGGRRVRRLLPAVGNPVDGRRHRPPAPARRSQQRAGEADPDRSPRGRRGGVADGPRKNRIVPRGQALPEALALAHQIASLPSAAMHSDRLSSYEQWPLALDDALAREYRHGMATLETGQTVAGLQRYASGEWQDVADAGPA